MAEDMVVDSCHLLNGHETEQTLGDSGDREAWCATVQDSVTEQQKHQQKSSEISLFIP